VKRFGLRIVNRVAAYLHSCCLRERGSGRNFEQFSGNKNDMKVFSYQ